MAAQGAQARVGAAAASAAHALADDTRVKAALRAFSQSSATTKARCRPAHAQRSPASARFSQP
jgi:hypothetical protein